MQISDADKIIRRATPTSMRDKPTMNIPADQDDNVAELKILLAAHKERESKRKSTEIIPIVMMPSFRSAKIFAVC